MNAEAFYYRQLKRYNENDKDLRSPDEFSIDCMNDFAKEVNGKLLPEPRVGQRLTQKDVFHLIIAQPVWYKGRFNKQAAFRWKKHFLNGTLGNRTIERLFNRFGFKKVETVWVKVK